MNNNAACNEVRKAPPETIQAVIADRKSVIEARRRKSSAVANRNGKKSILGRISRIAADVGSFITSRFSRLSLQSPAFVEPVGKLMNGMYASTGSKMVRLNTGSSEGGEVLVPNVSDVESGDFPDMPASVIGPSPLTDNDHVPRNGTNTIGRMVMFFSGAVLIVILICGFIAAFVELTDGTKIKVLGSCKAFKDASPEAVLHGFPRHCRIKRGAHWLMIFFFTMAGLHFAGILLSLRIASFCCRFSSGCFHCIAGICAFGIGIYCLIELSKNGGKWGLLFWLLWIGGGLKLLIGAHGIFAAYTAQALADLEARDGYAYHVELGKRLGVTDYGFGFHLQTPQHDELRYNTWKFSTQFVFDGATRGRFSPDRVHSHRKEELTMLASEPSMRYSGSESRYIGSETSTRASTKDRATPTRLTGKSMKMPRSQAKQTKVPPSTSSKATTGSVKSAPPPPPTSMKMPSSSSKKVPASSSSKAPPPTSMKMPSSSAKKVPASSDSKAKTPSSSTKKAPASSAKQSKPITEVVKMAASAMMPSSSAKKAPASSTSKAAKTVSVKTAPTTSTKSTVKPGKSMKIASSSEKKAPVAPKKSPAKKVRG